MWVHSFRPYGYLKYGRGGSDSWNEDDETISESLSKGGTSRGSTLGLSFCDQNYMSLRSHVCKISPSLKPEAWSLWVHSFRPYGYLKYGRGGSDSWNEDDETISESLSKGGTSRGSTLEDVVSPNPCTNTRDSEYVWNICLLCVCVWTCMYVYVYIYIHTYINTHTYIHTHETQNMSGIFSIYLYVCGHVTHSHANIKSCLMFTNIYKLMPSIHTQTPGFAKEHRSTHKHKTHVTHPHTNTNSCHSSTHTNTNTWNSQIVSF